MPRLVYWERGIWTLGLTIFFIFVIINSYMEVPNFFIAILGSSFKNSFAKHPSIHVIHAARDCAGGDSFKNSFAKHPSIHVIHAARDCAGGDTGGSRSR